MPANAALISFNVSTPNRSGASNTTYVFSGTISNDTGLDLNASDLSFDFSGFESGVVTPSQLLGNPDFSIPKATGSAITDLFSVLVNASAIPGQTYVMDAVLQDPAANLSDTLTVSIHIVPEPSAALVAASGALLVLLAYRYRCV